MKREEKTERTKKKILSAALHEFGGKGYEGTALNEICAKHGISKGLVYHNFKNKEDLYLSCVEDTFRTFIVYMKDKEIGHDLQSYMKLRYQFFEENPLLSRIFFEAVLQPPNKMEEEIRKLKKEFDRRNLEIYKAAIAQITLRPGVTEQEAVSYYSLIQEMFNGYFSSPAYSGTAFADLVRDHEKRLARLLDFILYGIAKEDLS